MALPVSGTEVLAAQARVIVVVIVTGLITAVIVPGLFLFMTTVVVPRSPDPGPSLLAEAHGWSSHSIPALR
jgi:hypothetical protein